MNRYFEIPFDRKTRFPDNASGLTAVNSYQTKLGGDGITLSTGQKQRIALARCILRNPKLLILDEPVSNVDPHSEQLIYQTVKTLAPDRIVVIISHKQETRAIADVVYRIKDAKLKLLHE